MVLKAITLYVDGAAYPSPLGHAGCGVVLVHEKQGRALGKYLGASLSSGESEVQAAIIGLSLLKQPCQVQVITDYRLLVDVMTGQAVKRHSLNLWQKLEQASKGHDMSWLWVKGHTGNRFNELADVFANRAMNQRSDVYGGYFTL